MFRISLIRTAILALLVTSALVGISQAADPAVPMQNAPTPDNMSPSKTIIDNISVSKNFTALTGTLNAAGLTLPLQGKGPFTIFAPNDMAFMGVGSTAVQTLLKPESKPLLTAILTYHVVKGAYTAADIAKLAAASGGTATLTTIEGEGLPITKNANGGWQITDSQGNIAQITIADQMQSNGVLHVIDKVLMPNK